MWTQKDRIQAYQFLRRRLVSALVTADANHPVSPSKRLVLGTAIGLAVAVLVSAVFGVIGLLSPTREEQWRQGGQVIVEEESGARFVLGVDDVLHPVLNYASARLLAGGDGSRTVLVPAEELAGVPRGAVVGIAGAPDSLPGTGRLLTGPWTTCTRQPSDRPAADPPIATVMVGHQPNGAPLPAGRGIVVRVPSGERFLVSGGRRYRLPDERSVVALGYAGADVIGVAPAWLDTIPAGRDLDVVTVPGAGRPGPVVGGGTTRLGQVLTTGPGEFYLVRADGLAVVTGTEALLVLGSPGAVDAYQENRPRPLPVASVDVAAAPRSAERAEGYPPRRPVPVAIERTATVCASDGRITVTAGPPWPGDAGPPEVSSGTGEVYVPGGGGAVVVARPAPGVTSGTVYVITDTGLKYPVSGDEAISALGYGSVRPHGVPASVLAMVPTGATLDPAAARRTVPR